MEISETAYTEEKPLIGIADYLSEIPSAQSFSIRLKYSFSYDIPALADHPIRDIPSESHRIDWWGNHQSPNGLEILI